jgi:hypothetical protein
MGKKAPPVEAVEPSVVEPAVVEHSPVRVAVGALITKRGVRKVGEVVELVEISGGQPSWDHLISKGIIK